MDYIGIISSLGGCCVEDIPRPQYVQRFGGRECSEGPSIKLDDPQSVGKRSQAVMERLVDGHTFEQAYIRLG
jgi:hypothetical protein